MPNIEAPIRSISTFDRLAQGSAARDAMITRVRSMAVASVSVVADEAPITEPIQISSKPSKRPGVLATGALGVISVSAAALAACGGGAVKGERSNLTPDPSVQGIAGEQAPPDSGSSPIIVPTETAVSPTAKVEAPTATAEAVQKKLSETVFKPTTFGEMADALGLAYERHPDIANIGFLLGPGKSRQEMQVTLDLCRDTQGNDKVGPCAAIVSIMYNAYDQTGYSEALDAATAAADYFLTVQPERREKLAEFLKAQIHQEPPAVQ